jgi:hypothetical protein
MLGMTLKFKVPSDRFEEQVVGWVRCRLVSAFFTWRHSEILSKERDENTILKHAQYYWGHFLENRWPLPGLLHHPETFVVQICKQEEPKPRQKFCSVQPDARSKMLVCSCLFVGKTSPSFAGLLFYIPKKPTHRNSNLPAEESKFYLSDSDF